MKHFHLLLVFFVSFTLSAQSVDDCEAGIDLILAEDLEMAIAQDTPLVAGDTTFYCVDAETGEFLINNQPISEVTVFSEDPTLPFKAIITTILDGDDLVDTLDQIGESFTIIEGRRFLVEVIALNVGLGEIQTNPLGLAALASEPDTIEVRVIAALPVVWGAPLSYRREKARNRFQWSVTQQSDAESYELQRLANGKFKTVEYLDATGPAEGEVWYEAHDIQYATATNYRIRQTDYDGAVAYSNLVTVPGSATYAGLRVFPNPVSTEVNYTFDGALRAASLYNTVGKLVRKIPAPPSSGTLAVNDLPPGLYLLSVIDNRGKRYTKRIQVR